MVNNAETLILEFGQNITITHPSKEDLKSKAFIQPLRSDYQSPLYMDYAETEGKEQFLYIGPANIKLNKSPSGAVISTELKDYIIKKVEVVYLSSKPVYERAVLEEKEEN